MRPAPSFDSESLLAWEPNCSAIISAPKTGIPMSMLRVSSSLCMLCWELELSWCQPEDGGGRVIASLDLCEEGGGRVMEEEPLA